jgi:hypothetical protein
MLLSAGSAGGRSRGDVLHVLSSATPVWQIHAASQTRDRLAAAKGGRAHAGGLREGRVAPGAKTELIDWRVTR